MIETGQLPTRRPTHAGRGTGNGFFIDPMDEHAYTGRHGERRCVAEKRLAMAVLDDALGILLRPPSAMDSDISRQQERKRAETLAWLASDERWWPFAFVRLCELFDLDVQAARVAIAQLIERAHAPSPPLTPELPVAPPPREHLYQRALRVMRAEGVVSPASLGQRLGLISSNQAMAVLSYLVKRGLARRVARERYVAVDDGNGPGTAPDGPGCVGSQNQARRI